MASLSIAAPLHRGWEPGPWALRIDASGAIQCLDGTGYCSLLARITGGNPALAEAVSSGIRAVGAGQADTFSLELPGCLPDRKMRPRLVATPYRQGAIEGVLLEQTDADAPRDPQAFKMEAVGRLASGIAHDFANLVTLISGYSDILLHRIGAWDPSRPELEEIGKAAARGASVTSQILDFVRKQAPSPAIVQLNTLVAETLRLLRPIIGEHIALVVTLDPNLGAVRADASQISRVVMNLVLNARDAMPRGGSIRIRTANGDGHVVLEVSDTGDGMDPETLRRIFQPFFSTKKRGGTGLGLHTVHGIVEQAGGGIRTRSEPGRGTTFTICLPRVERDGRTAESRDVPRAPRAGTETILLAEDEESVRRLLTHFLRAAGYRVIEAADGLDALRVFEQHAGGVDLLLTDIIMPGLDGREVARKAQVSQPGLKVIYISGYTDDVLLNAGEFGPDISFLRKPLKLDSLTALIREVLDA